MIADAKPWSLVHRMPLASRTLCVSARGSRRLEITGKELTYPSLKRNAAHGSQRSGEESEKGSTPPIHSVARLLVTACLFALAGGSLDAYSYLTHDHVFSTAESGNVVQFGVYASGGDWGHALHFLPPIGTFVLGVAVARLLGAQTQKHTFRATLICQGIEGTVLFFLALFGSDLSGRWVVPLLAFCAALQNTSFNALGPWKFNDAMTTGNLRIGTSSAIFWLLGRDREKNRGQAIVSYIVMTCFLSGALFGGIYTRYDSRHALVPAVVLVSIGFVLTWRERYRNMQHPSAVRS